MIPVTTFAGRRVALFGLGGSGLATACALKAGGAEVVVADDSAEAVEKAPAEGFAAADLAAMDWAGIGALILSPGVPLTHKGGKPFTHPVVAVARAAGAEVIGDIELFCRERAARAPESSFIAITGTNGKSTTTALIAHILREAGFDAQMGGNIGKPILELEPPSRENPRRVHVIEVSSFQIDLAPSLAPTIGVLLNITPDHLDRHGTMEAYAAIKERLVARAELAIISADDPWCSVIAKRRLARSLWTNRISTKEALEANRWGEAYFARDSRVLRSLAHWGHVDWLADLAGIATLRGLHNMENALASAAACTSLYSLFWKGSFQRAIYGEPRSSPVARVEVKLWDDVSRFHTQELEESSANDLMLRIDKLQSGLASFPGLPHRMEEVGRAGRVLFINDSKATNADSTEKALLSFPEGIHWIVGGVMKEGGIAPLAPLFPRIAKAYLVGASSEAFAATLEGKAAYQSCGTLAVALDAAARDAATSDAKEPVVLLSPACASYDQFKSFEERGDLFRSLARQRLAPKGHKE